MSILLIQIGYPHGGQRIYLPGGVMNLASRLMAIGQEVQVIDLDLDDLALVALDGVDLIGLSVLGKPYIPGTLRCIATLRARGFTGEIVVGGMGVEEMEPELFRSFFGTEATSSSCAMEFGGGTFPNLPSQYEISMVAALKNLPAERRRTYLTREFGLWLSQGCLMNCDFCDAPNRREEKYRDWESLKEEVAYICEELVKFGHRRFEAYLSNLDGFQNPLMLELAIKIIYKIATKHGLEVHLRCLSTLAYFCKATKNNPALLERLSQNGLRIVAFGVDGADPRTWAREHKNHNTLELVKTAMERCLAGGIQPEMLMVIGFRADDGLAMSAAILLSIYWAWRGVVIRPYLGKPILKTMSVEELALYWQKPDRLLNLDYAMLASRETHPDDRQRRLVNLTYLTVIGLLTPFGRNTTFPIIPFQGGRFRRWVAKVINRLMPADR